MTLFACTQQYMVPAGTPLPSAKEVSRIAFSVQPSGGLTGKKFNVQPKIVFQDSSGNQINPTNTEVRIALTTNPGSATLSGGATSSISCTQGACTFSDLSLDQPGTGYILTATSGTFAVRSLPFNIQLDTSKMVQLKYLDSNLTPPYIKVRGSAITGNPEVLFDTGSTALAISHNYVNDAAVTVVVPDVQDHFGHDADLVRGQVQVTSEDGLTHYTVNDFLFFRTKDNWSIFGAFPRYFPQGSYCITNLFMALDYTKYGPSAQVPGYALVSASDHQAQMTLPFNLYLQLGLQQVPTDTLWHQYPSDPAQCVGAGGRKTVKPDWIENFAINFNPLGLTTSSPAQPNATILTDRDATIDTGAPDFNVQDDENNTIRTLMQDALTSCRPASWLTGCQCFKPGYPVEVSYSANGTKGSFLTEGVAVCNYGEWPFTTRTRRINNGTAFYYGLKKQMYDLTEGKVGLSFPTNSSNPNYYSIGGPQTFTVPPNVTSVHVKMWGAGGGGSPTGQGGSGAFVSGTIPVEPGEKLTVIVGQGGTSGCASGTSGPGAGGGRSAVISERTGLEWMTAGAGGGSGGARGGGNGGFPNGTAGPSGDSTFTTGGTASSGGLGGGGLFAGTNGTSRQGGNENGLYNSGNNLCNSGGYGGGGAGSVSGVNNGGGGGSSHYDSKVKNPITLSGSGASAPATSEPSYIPGVAVGGPSSDRGGHGLVVISY